MAGGKFNLPDVNAAVGLMATGGSTNHAIHLPAIARAAGIVIDWQDLEEISEAVPLLARVYPNGSGDVNDFHYAGGVAFVAVTESQPEAGGSFVAWQLAQLSVQALPLGLVLPQLEEQLVAAPLGHGPRT